MNAPDGAALSAFDPHVGMYLQCPLCGKSFVDFFALRTHCKGVGHRGDAAHKAAAKTISESTCQLVPAPAGSTKGVPFSNGGRTWSMCSCGKKFHGAKKLADHCKSTGHEDAGLKGRGLAEAAAAKASLQGVERSGYGAVVASSTGGVARCSCGKQFKFKAALNDHCASTGHMGVEEVASSTCGVARCSCGKQFKMKAALNDHCASTGHSAVEEAGVEAEGFGSSHARSDRSRSRSRSRSSRRNVYLD
eukprot:TRINITY_DN7767_c0_g1_i1.p1 TRINITY_DN7767_c0_g1~~TRINITY_DN7767_c0_g1_i1.p1  ORF type:complete len:248 (+),score=36.89 TRINITY_DN7767_c0_g1_i1:456-1199(+)